MIINSNISNTNLIRFIKTFSIRTIDNINLHRRKLIIKKNNEKNHLINSLKYQYFQNNYANMVVFYVDHL